MTTISGLTRADNTGKKFILFTDHKPLEKMGHLHTKTMNRLQAALLEHDFIIQYKKLLALCRKPQIQHYTVDHLARGSMKNGANSVTQCELQDT